MDGMTEQLVTMLAERFNVAPERIRPETHLVADLGADSLDMVEFIMEIEERLGVTIGENEAEQLQTFGDALALVRTKGPS